MINTTTVIDSRLASLIKMLHAGETVTLNVEGATYVLQVISIKRGEMTESFVDDVKTLQQMLRDANSSAEQHLDRLLKCRRQKRKLMARVKELENG